jgi:hypothetical protein
LRRQTEAEDAAFLQFFCKDLSHIAVALPRRATTMASVQRKGDRWYCQFCYRGGRHTFTIGKVSEAEAKAKSAQVEYLLLRLKQRLIELPPGVGIVDFIQFDGKPPTLGTATAPRRLTFAAFRDCYLETHAESLEDRTLHTTKLHFKHLTRILGDGFPIRELKLADLQGYADRRSREKTAEGKRISPATIRKEIMTLRTAWNWGVNMEMVPGRYPSNGVRYRKTDEKQSSWRRSRTTPSHRVKPPLGPLVPPIGSGRPLSPCATAIPAWGAARARAAGTAAVPGARSPTTD